MGGGVLCVLVRVRSRSTYIYSRHFYKEAKEPKCKKKFCRMCFTDVHYIFHEILNSWDRIKICCL